MKFAFVFAVVTVAANIVFIWYVIKRYKIKPDKPPASENGVYAFSKGYLNTPEASKLRKSTAAELGLSIEELDRMLSKEIKQLATEKELTNIES